MGLLNLVNPIEGIRSVKTLLKDISNYQFYRKQIKSIEAAGFFESKKIRTDWLRRVYYVVNLEPELQLATGDLIDLEKSRVFDSVSKIQGVFADHNLTEIVEVTSNRIKTEDYYAYLVTIKYRVESNGANFFSAVILGVLLYWLIRLGVMIGTNWESVTAFLAHWLNSK